MVIDVRASRQGGHGSDKDCSDLIGKPRTHKSHRNTTPTTYDRQVVVRGPGRRDRPDDRQDGRAPGIDISGTRRAKMAVGQVLISVFIHSYAYRQIGSLSHGHLTASNVHHIYTKTGVLEVRSGKDT